MIYAFLFSIDQCIYIYIYIYIEREREREKEQEGLTFPYDDVKYTTDVFFLPWCSKLCNPDGRSLQIIEGLCLKLAIFGHVPWDICQTMYFSAETFMCQCKHKHFNKSININLIFMNIQIKHLSALHINVRLGGTFVIIIFIRNGPSNPSSNSGQSCLHFTWRKYI